VGFSISRIRGVVRSTLLELRLMESMPVIYFNVAYVVLWETLL
jgi:hypothetical protein